MHVGVCIFATEYAIRIDELAREAESRGFESLWVPEHTHIPTSRRSPIGGGWNAEEMGHHGTDFNTRFKRLEEQVRALKEIWTKDVAEFHGKFVNFDPMWAWPKPEQKPHPPILLGGESSYTLQRVVDFCDGWYPRGRAPEKVLEGMKDLKARAAKAGRDMRTISVSAFATPPDKKVLDDFAAAGVTRSIFLLPPEPRDKVLPLLDQYAKLIR